MINHYYNKNHLTQIQIKFFSRLNQIMKKYKLIIYFNKKTKKFKKLFYKIILKRILEVLVPK